MKVLGVNPDDYRFLSREPYEQFNKAVVEGRYEKTAQDWIRFIDTRRADRVLAAEFILDDILDAEEVG